MRVDKPHTATGFVLLLEPGFLLLLETSRSKRFVVQLSRNKLFYYFHHLPGKFAFDQHFGI